MLSTAPSSVSNESAAAETAGDGLIQHLRPALVFSLVSIAILGIAYPLLMTLLLGLVFPAQANGSLIRANGTVLGSDLVGQLWTKPQYFHGRPSAAGKNGYDPTATGGTNLGPTSKKLIDATRLAIAAVHKENPDASGVVPIDLVTSSGSGVDPDISPEAAYYQVARIAKARGVPQETVRAIVAEHVHPRELGFLGEPHANVLELNRALDGIR